jgi:hypothetical protein
MEIEVLVFDLLVIGIVGLATYVEATRGAVLALADLIRIFLTAVLAIVGYTLTFAVFKSFFAGLVGLLGLGMITLMVTTMLFKRMAIDPHHGQGPFGRILGGLMGLALGAGLTLAIVPAVAQADMLVPRMERTYLASRVLDAIPVLHDAADQLGVRIPRIRDRTRKFRNETLDNADVFASRINFRKLDGATCIECGSPVEFEGYRRLKGTTVAPLFVCPECGRTSDGCQTFEAFHRMYRRCPYEMPMRGVPLDCGIWPNDRPILPETECPICGRGAR